MTKFAFVFPGQASQFVGMGKDLYHKCRLVSEFYDQAEGQFDFSLKELSFYGPLKELTKTKVTQPAIFVHSVGLYEELQAKGCVPAAVAGHSLGEYSALVAAGALSFKEGLQLVKVRAEQMQMATEHSTGTMAAIVGLSYEKVKTVLDESQASGICNIANYNSPVQIVISGETSAVQSAMMSLKKAGAKRAIELSVGGAFHSPLMEDARVKLKEALDAAHFTEPQFPIYSNVTGTPTKDPQVIKERLNAQLTSPVLWVNTIENMITDGFEKFIEVGPGKVLQGLIKRISKQVTLQGVSSNEDLKSIECA